MRRLLSGLLMLFACVPVAAQVGSTDVPKELPAGIKEWEEFPSCHRLPPCVITLANATVEYDLYSSPEHPMMYVISHYRVTPTGQTGVFAGWAKDYRAREVLLWWEYRGTTPSGMPNARIFIHEATGWREAEADSSELKIEMSIANRLVSVHNRIGPHGEAPASLTF